MSWIAALLFLQSGRTVQFSYTAEKKLDSVVVVGQFNDWDKSANPLRLSADGHTWITAFPIKPGIYEYLFCLNGNSWIPDPNGVRAKDTNGNSNSLIIVPPESYSRLPGKRGDGLITIDAVEHRPTRKQAARLGKRTGYFTLRTRAHDVENVDVLIAHAGAVRRYPMHVVSADPLYEFWQGSFVNQPGWQTRYAFELKDGNATLRFPRSAGWFYQPFSRFPLPKPVGWAKRAVFYQIFPERFANGDPSNDGPGVQPWGTLPTGRNRMGGDLEGIRDHLAHLKDLGVNAIYLNPVFESGTNHGYNTFDYLKVDHRFGNNRDLRALVSDAHGSGMRVILDGVFNHSGTQFFAFKNLVKNGPASPYKDWYFVSKYPVRVAEGQRSYRTFAGVQSMPKLNQDNPATRDYFLKVGTHWIRYAGIDGWRLDVGDEVSQDFWRRFRRAIKSEKRDAFIVGEEWGNAHEWLQGDQHDSVMNYLWRDAVLQFFSKDDETNAAFEEKLRTIRDYYAPAVLPTMFNLLGSHDTERLRRVMKGDLQRVKLSVVFQFTYPGTPCIYYGDEIGMDGGKDPDDRRCMIWDKGQWNMDLYRLYKRLVHLRTTSTVLANGSYTPIVDSARPGLVAFRRIYGNRNLTVYLNRAARAETVPLAVGTRRLVMGDNASVSGQGLRLEPMGFAILN